MGCAVTISAKCLAARSYGEKMVTANDYGAFGRRTHWRKTLQDKNLRCVHDRGALGGLLGFFAAE
jgi:hypothetical protein